jgi:hypothetical protein
MATARELWTAYRLRWKRRRLLYRAVRKRGQIAPVADRTDAIRPGDILVFATVRNEAARLQVFLAHHRRLGVAHFLVVDNSSDDGTAELLAGQPDTSVWTTAESYRLSRFGLDWLTWLMIRHGHGHWCLTLDADELLIYPHWETRSLPALTGWLDAQGQAAFPAMMLELYPRGPLGTAGPAPGADPRAAPLWFDAGNYTVRRQEPLGNLWIQGGPRARTFFADNPRRAPTLNKTPLVRWNRRYVYVNSTHALLPRRLNATYATDGGEAISGALLHTKFLADAPARAAAEKARGEHFAHGALHAEYYDALAASPDLWVPHALPLGGWRQLEAAGLISRGGWV